MFHLTQELIDQLNLHMKWQVSLCCGGRHDDEPFNPWPGIAAQMVKAVECVHVGWSDHEEMCIDYIEQYIDDNSFYDHIRHRYQVGAMDAQTVIENLKQFTALRQYYH